MKKTGGLCINGYENVPEHAEKQPELIVAVAFFCNGHCHDAHRCLKKVQRKCHGNFGVASLQGHTVVTKQTRKRGKILDGRTFFGLIVETRTPI
jgi:hypothetical protein